MTAINGTDLKASVADEQEHSMDESPKPAVTRPRPRPAAADPETTSQATPVPEGPAAVPAGVTITIKLPSLRRKMATQATEPGSPGNRGHRRKGSRARLIVVSTLLLLVVAALAITDGVLYSRTQDASRVAAARTAAVADATTRVPKILSYSPTSIGSFAATAKANTTGSFQTSYGKLVAATVVPEATAKKLSTSMTISGSAVVAASASHVVVLLFFTQTSSAANGTPTVNVGRMNVTMTHVGSTWLVSNILPL